MGDRYCTRRRTATSQPTEEPITNAADKQGKLKSQSVTTEKTSDKQSKRRKRSSLEVEKTIIEDNTRAAGSDSATDEEDSMPRKHF
jgi:hypothetical protein